MTANQPDKPGVGTYRRSALGLFLWLAWAGSIHARAVPFGSTNIEPQTVFRFSAPVSNQVKLVLQRGGYQPVDLALGALALPAGFNPTNRYPILVVNATSDGPASSIAAMSGFMDVALKLGWVVLAADGPGGKPAKDDLTWRWSMLSSVLARVQGEWPASRSWPVACAGFSGGAKWSAYVAATLVRQGYPVVGLFMGGSNEDAASLALSYYHPGAGFKDVPIFLSNGTVDSIAPPARAVYVKQSLDRYGFKRVRFETYVGDHRLSQAHEQTALRWFHEVMRKAPPPLAKPSRTPEVPAEPKRAESPEPDPGDEKP